MFGHYKKDMIDVSKILNSFNDGFQYNGHWKRNVLPSLAPQKHRQKKTSPKPGAELKGLSFIVCAGLCPLTKQRLCYSGADVVDPEALWACWKACWWEGTQMDGGQRRLLGRWWRPLLWEARTNNEGYRWEGLWREEGMTWLCKLEQWLTDAVKSITVAGSKESTMCFSHCFDSHVEHRVPFFKISLYDICV